MSDVPEILWEASLEQKQASHLHRFIQWLQTQKGLTFTDYQALHQWSVSDINAFWCYFVEYAELFEYKKEKAVVVKSNTDFIHAKWFEGIQVNYAEYIFRNSNDRFPALIFSQESTEQLIEISWRQLYANVASLSSWMKQVGIKKGDRVVSVLPNIPESVIAFLAAQSIGAIWSSCSPDFGNDAIVQRFAQVEPSLLIASVTTTYNGKVYDKTEQINYLKNSIRSLNHVIVLNSIDKESTNSVFTEWDTVMQINGGVLSFEPLSFDHPIWILYSSGTTGLPKAITHSVGGNLIEHIKVLTLHWDVNPGERFFWYSTTGWMMWNFSVASLLVGATLVIYDGSPSYPTINRLWNLAESAKIHHLGLGAAFLIHCQQSQLNADDKHFSNLRTIGATGSPLTPEAFRWVYNNIKSDVWLISFSGGTDVCSGFVGGSILLPVVEGEIQCRLLGCDLDAVDEMGNGVKDRLGEMVIRKPMPSMPLYFWKDTNHTKYRDNYFEKYPGIWWHGDFIIIKSSGSIVVMGRSDATLNRDGVRIGTAEIYRVLNQLSYINDSLIVCLERENGTFHMPLFVKFNLGSTLTNTVEAEIKSILRKQCSPRHVPDVVYAVEDIPYTISGKKMEIPVKRILMGVPIDESASLSSVSNPSALFGFTQYILPEYRLRNQV